MVKYQVWLNLVGKFKGDKMSFVDPIGDMITRIRNAQMRALNKVSIPYRALRPWIWNTLLKDGPKGPISSPGFYL